MNFIWTNTDNRKQLAFPGFSPDYRIKTSPLLPLLVFPKRLGGWFFTAASPVQPPPATTNEPFLIRAHCVTSLSLWWSFSLSPTGFRSVRRFTGLPWSLAQPPLQDVGRVFWIQFFILMFARFCLWTQSLIAGTVKDKSFVVRRCVPQLLFGHQSIIHTAGRRLVLCCISFGDFWFFLHFHVL